MPLLSGASRLTWPASGAGEPSSAWSTPPSATDPPRRRPAPHRLPSGRWRARRPPGRVGVISRWTAVPPPPCGQTNLVVDRSARRAETLECAHPAARSGRGGFGACAVSYRFGSGGSSRAPWTSRDDLLSASRWNSCLDHLPPNTRRRGCQGPTCGWGTITPRIEDPAGSRAALAAASARPTGSALVPVPPVVVLGPRRGGVIVPRGAASASAAAT